MLLLIVISGIWVVPFARHVILIQEAVAQTVGEISHCLCHFAYSSGSASEEIVEVKMTDVGHLRIVSLCGCCGFTISLSKLIVFLIVYDFITLCEAETESIALAAATLTIATEVVLGLDLDLGLGTSRYLRSLRRHRLRGRLGSTTAHSLLNRCRHVSARESASSETTTRLIDYHAVCRLLKLDCQRFVHEHDD